jgi:hypothetical protein
MFCLWPTCIPKFMLDFGSIQVLLPLSLVPLQVPIPILPSVCCSVTQVVAHFTVERRASHSYLPPLGAPVLGALLQLLPPC